MTKHQRRFFRIAYLVLGLVISAGFTWLVFSDWHFAGSRQIFTIVYGIIAMVVGPWFIVNGAFPVKEEEKEG